MTIANDVTVLVSYIIVALSAVFGMYNAISFLYYSGDQSKLTLIMRVVWEYAYGSLFGLVLFQVAVVLIVLILMFFQREKQLKLKKFMVDINVNIFKIIKTALKNSMLANPQSV